ncbi:toxin [Wenjunlia vitaminophila]|uniref:Toxin n=1 Tax=Wenjunlia vitaminophila TaxID=76728 RepID=A0A0T6LRI7_WENVI|nr:DUF397 domain-containing protein [Wenjunlia vitaminophila]KRV48661.1 toxin [Wenjunlia vitaminophila]
MTAKVSDNGTTDREWIKSSYSTAAGAECIEVAYASDAVQVRDSKNSNGPYLSFSPSAWEDFIVLAASLG